MAKKGTIFKWVLLVLLAGYVCTATVWAHYESLRHMCTGIEVNVEGNPQMAKTIRQGVEEELHNYPTRIVGSQLKQINTQDIERYLGRLNTFESVHCMIASDGKLSVGVVPLVPVMRVFFGNNSYYINKEGKHIASNAEFYSDVPVVTGNFKHDFQPQQVLPLVRFVNEDPMMRDLTSMIVAQDAHNLLIVPRVSGHVVNFGDTTRLAEKRRALATFYREVMPYKGWNEYDTISVKFRGQVVATRRDKARLNHAEEEFEEVDLEEGTLPDGGGHSGEGTETKTENKTETTKLHESETT